MTRRDNTVKILIASPDANTSRQLNTTLGEMAPTATYFHSDCAERVLDLITSHRLDLVVLDLQLLAKNSAASKLLRMLDLSVLSITSSETRLQVVDAVARPHILLTFDSSEEGASGVLSRLRALGTPSSAISPKVRDGATIWAQDENGEWCPVDVEGLKWAVSEQGRVKLYHASKNVYSVRDPLRELEKQLGLSQFVRIHKSYLVNSAYVSEVQRWSSGGLLLKIDGIRLPVSRRYVTAFRQRTGWGVGPVYAAACAG
jgi:two-component system response regulator LytT